MTRPAVTGKPAEVLIVDDIEENRDILRRRMTALGHIPFMAENGKQALEHVATRLPDLILLDLTMPEMDGYEVLDRLKADARTRHLPVIVITAVNEEESKVRCIKNGAEDYLDKPINATLLKARVGACLERKRLRDLEEEYRNHLEEKVQAQVKEISSAQLGTIFALAKLAESRDSDTGEHLERVREYCGILARQLCTVPRYADLMTAKFIDDLCAASPLHDIGKVGIADDILKKKGKLTADEFAVMQSHTTCGAETLKAVAEKHPGNDFIHLGIDIAAGHHEKWDGSGYPQRLAGETIPLVARILALADVYDALTSKRCYKEAMPAETARSIIVDGKGKHFDPEVVDAFLAVEAEFLVVRQRFQKCAADPEA